MAKIDPQSESGRVYQPIQHIGDTSRQAEVAIQRQNRQSAYFTDLNLPSQKKAGPKTCPLLFENPIRRREIIRISLHWVLF